MADHQKRKFPKLSKAPIILAILEVKFAPAKGLKMSDLKSLRGVFKDTYPNYLEVSNAEIKFSAGLGKTPVSVRNTGVSGLTFTSIDKKHDFHLNLNSFNFKQHAQYDTWESFKELALTAWERCSERIMPITLSRLSIRYINNIEIPVAAGSHSQQQDFFKTFIANTGTVVKGRPISNYFLRFTHPPGEDNIHIHFAQELKLGPAGKYPFIIDIDVIYEKEISPKDMASVSRKLDELSEIKNQYFFDNLSEYTYNLIK